MTPDLIPGHIGIRGTQAYNEAAFRWFLNADRIRARRLHRPLFLVLVAVNHQPGRAARLPEAMVSPVFRGLASSVREVDFVGWFREGYVAGALLVQGPRQPDPAAVVHITERIKPALTSHVSASVARTLRVRVVRLGGLLNAGQP